MNRWLSWFSTDIYVKSPLTFSNKISRAQLEISIYLPRIEFNAELWSKINPFLEPPINIAFLFRR